MNTIATRWLTTLALASVSLLPSPIAAQDNETTEKIVNDPEAQARFITQSRRLTIEGRRAGEGYFSPGDGLMVLSSEREPGNPFYQIYVLDLRTGDSHRVSPGIGKTTCAYFRSKNDELLFSSTHLDPEAEKKQKEEIEFRESGKERRYSWDYDEHYDVFSANIDGTGLTRLTDAPGYDAEAAYSPDGEEIVFTSNRHAFPAEDLSEEDRKRMEYDQAYFLDLYIMDADGSNQRRLTDWPGYDGGPFFSPDGESIVWRHFTEDMMQADVYTIKTDGSDVRRLTNFHSMSWAPFFHPSGEYVIFTSNKLGFENFELYIVDADGTREPVRVTFTDGFDGLPIFSSSGDLLSWTSNRTENDLGQIFLARWNHRAALAALEEAPLREISTSAEESGRVSTGGSGPPAPEGNDPPFSYLQPLAGASPARSGADRARSYPFAQESQEKPKKVDPTKRRPHEDMPHSSAERQAAMVAPVPPALPADLSAEVTALDLGSHVGFLASDEMEGRMTGTPQIARAADYIAENFRHAGLEPAGDDGTYFQEFEFTAGVDVVAEESGLRLNWAGDEVESISFEVQKDFRPLSFSSNGSFEGEVVFAGYGLFIPGSMEEGYDSYGDIDVKDKVVVVLRYVPEEVSVERRSELNQLASLRYKAMIAREREAKAILVVTGPNSPNAGELVSLTLDTSLQGSGILAASITSEVADAILSASGKTLQELQDGLDVENPHFEGTFAVPDITIDLELALERRRQTCRNVVGMLPPAGANEVSEYVVLGAHYDHIGRGEAGGSLAHKGEEGMIHNGADDNASGTAVVLELAAALAAARAEGDLSGRRGLLFACWSGEEIGLIGSHHFAENPPVPLENMAAYFNFDMVGRMRENKLLLQGTGSSPDWNKIIERKNVVAGFDIDLKDDPYLPTDATSFYPKKVPVLAFFTGSHEDYNRPTDDATTLDYAAMERIGLFARALAIDVAEREERPAYAEVERPKSQSAGRSGLRAYTGTIPDYAADDVQGVKLSGVRADGPADKAGLRGGDVIVELAGLEITNIYDYTFALNAVKIGEPVDVIVLRDGERLTLTIIPEAR